MHEISELVQFAAPIASAGGLAAIARVASARRARRLSGAISPGALEIDTVEREMDGAKDLAGISTNAATRPKGMRVLRSWKKGLVTRE